MTATSRARQQYARPTHPGGPISLPEPPRKVKFRHPGYPDNANILLQFSAYDEINGVHYRTAHVACAIVAHNRWDGYFSTDREGSLRIEPLSQDDTLEEDDYYFHVPNMEDYTIIPTFTDWPFPHDDLPPSWPHRAGRLFASDDRPQLPNRCCMTQSTLLPENAHIVPWKDKLWWDVNMMSRYGQAEQSIDSPSNMVRLRVDVHQLFDRKPRFAIVPKYDAMVAHMFAADDAAEAVQLYHNVPLQDLDGVKIEYLLARMAWTVFPLLGMFLSARRKRKVLRLGPNNDWQVQELSGEECFRFYGPTPKSRSSSPRKRTAAQATGRGDEPQNESREQDNEDEDHKEGRRGRKRRRSSSVSLNHSSRTPNSGELPRSSSEGSESTPSTPGNQPAISKPKGYRRMIFQPPSW